MSGADAVVEPARLLLFGAGFAVASFLDLRSREIGEGLWQILGVGGVVLGTVAFATAGALPLLLWLLVGAFALEHLFPWEDVLGSHAERWVTPIEIVSYLAVIVVVASAAARYGFGGAGVPLSAIAVVVTVVLTRVLFEVGFLHGGADARAVITVGTILPLVSVPWLAAASFQSPVLEVVPFAVTVLTNAAVLSLVVPLSLAVRNVRRREFSFPAGFTGYSLPAELLPRRFVWVRDPHLGEDSLADDVETSEEDLRRRTEMARELARRGVRRVWVSPQIPFVVLISLGALAGVLAGNVLLELFSVF